MPRSLALAAIVLACACSKKRPEAPDTSSIATAEGRAKLVALMKPDGALPVDRSIAELQGLVQRQPDKLEGWLALGHAWIVKARESQRPSLYANAGACADTVLARQPENRLALELQGLVLMND